MTADWLLNGNNNWKYTDYENTPLFGKDSLGNMWCLLNMFPNICSIKYIDLTIDLCSKDTISDRVTLSLQRNVLKKLCYFAIIVLSVCWSCGKKNEAKSHIFRDTIQKNKLSCKGKTVWGHHEALPKGTTRVKINILKN